MLFNYTCVLMMLLALFCGGSWASASSCPTGFNAENSRCVKERPVHGTCPPGSNYQLNINKCVHG
ncbi:uncharacterized protein [Drosophila tropicalis]